MKTIFFLKLLSQGLHINFASFETYRVLVYSYMALVKILPVILRRLWTRSYNRSNILDFPLVLLWHLVVLQQDAI